MKYWANNTRAIRHALNNKLKYNVARQCCGDYGDWNLPIEKDRDPLFYIPGEYDKEFTDVTYDYDDWFADDIKLDFEDADKYFVHDYVYEYITDHY